MVIDRDVWSVVCRFAFDDTLVALHSVVPDLAWREIRARLRTTCPADPQQNLRSFHNDGMYSTENGEHRCDHAGPHDCEFVYHRKTGDEMLLMNRLHLCRLCYTYGFFSGPAPITRWGGRMYRHRIIVFLDNPDEQIRWFLDPKRRFIFDRLPPTYECRYYGDPALPVFEQARRDCYSFRTDLCIAGAGRTDHVSEFII